MSHNLLEQAKAQRERVLWAEIGGWLHDLGKLSSGFIRSKTDPAYHTAEAREAPADATPAAKWLHHSKVLEDDRQQGMFAASLPVPNGWGTVSIADLIAEHHSDSRSERLIRLLQRADGEDSGEDEYNAISAQQGPVQAATVFGREEPLAGGDLTKLDSLRQGLYGDLGELLKDMPKKRQEIWRLLQEALSQGLGKTQRAANDVRLDQHVWGVTARFKAFLLRDLLDPPPADEKRPRRTFRLLTVRWNWWEAVTPFARLSDVVGRAMMLGKLREWLRFLIEDKYALGNRVYEDDDGVHLMIADLPWDQSELEREIRTAVNEVTGGEVQPVVRLGPSTHRVTDLAAQMRQARQMLPTVGEPAWVQEWADTPSGVVCPVCRRRPLEGERELCPWCEERRREGIRERIAREGTVWSGEIADEHGRVALLVARFDLDEWLDGTMLHTLFITSPQDMAAARNLPVPVQEWQALRQALDGLPREFLQPVSSPQEIQGREREVREWSKGRQDVPGALARRIVGRFGRLQDVATAARELAENYHLPLPDTFLLALARKNPSASRLLRVWQTTEAFLRAQADGLRERIPTRQRAVLTLEPHLRPGLYLAQLPGLGRTELFIREDGRAQTLSRLSPAQMERLREASGQKVRLLAREGGGRMDRDCTMVKVAAETYRPYQVVTASPNLLLVMLPAGQAMEVAEALQRAYAAEFGKVQGRLSLHLGLIFLDAHYPMFAALDAARRLVETFDALGSRWAEATVEAVEEKSGEYDLTLSSERFGRWTWHIPARRGDGETDWYHPYLLVRDGEVLEGRAMSLLGPEGRWVHVSQVRPGDRVAFRPSLFDFLFLDTVSRRLEAHADPRSGRRPHPLFAAEQSPRPYLLEQVGELRRVWETLCRIPGMSETRLQGVTTLLARKLRAWQADPVAQQSYAWLVQETTARDLGGEPSLRQAILDGRFFDAVELYRHILKRKIEPPSSGASSHARGDGDAEPQKEEA